MRQSDNSEAVDCLRVMRPSDVTNLSDLWVASWREAMPDIDFEARRDLLVAFLGRPGCATLVAEAHGRQVGFVTLEGAYLHQLVVAPHAKGGGTAGRLIAAAKSSAREGLTLEVNQANARAVRFYEREGFAIETAGRNPTSGLPTWRMRWCATSPREDVA